jgi:RNA polymerase sigma-70 factor (ECF subfamily)
MVGHAGRQSGGTLLGSDTEVNSFPVRDLRIFASEQRGLAERCQRIAELYDVLRPPLYSYLGYLGLNSDQAEDVIQDAFLSLISCRFDARRQDNVRAWIFRVAHNLSMDIHRTQRRWSRRSDDEPHSIVRERIDPAPSPEQQILLEERMNRFEHTFAQLTPKQRQCVMLRAKGSRYREIAITLEVSVQRVGELMQRSIALLEADK